MKKKLLALGLAAALSVTGVAAFAGCAEEENNVDLFGGNGDATLGNVVTPETPEVTDAEAYKNIKIGFIFLHDESSTYDNNFISAVKEVKEELGLTDDQIIMKTNIEEGDICYETAADLAEQGCKIVFADSFGHEAYMLKAAKEYPNVQFCHATGTQAIMTELNNYHNAFATIYEGRYLAGYAAGMKLVEMNKADSTKGYKMGYIGAFPYAEVVSGYTSFYLGAKAAVAEAEVTADVTMTVRYTNSWYDLNAEKTTAETLINSDKCVLISQHADSIGAPSACQEAGVPNVSYNGSMKEVGPDSYIVSSRINWAPYFEYIINSVVTNNAIAKDWAGTIENGSVEILEINSTVAAEGTAEKLEEVASELIAGTRYVFDTNNFTVQGGRTIASYLADVQDAGDFAHDTEVVGNGYFHESLLRSAPYFDIRIDGITEA